MKIWKIEAYIETDDNFSKKDIVSTIYTDLNRGDGLYMDTENCFDLKLIKKVKESESD
jgi:hypothetical protein